MEQRLQMLEQALQEVRDSNLQLLGALQEQKGSDAGGLEWTTEAGGTRLRRHRGYQAHRQAKELFRPRGGLAGMGYDDKSLYGSGQ